MNMRNKTALLLLLIIAAALLGIGVRCFYLQYYKADYYHEASVKSQKSSFFERPRRGSILDCRGRTLAASYKVDTVFAEARIINDLKKTTESLAAIIDMDPVEISKLILTARNPGYAPIVTDAKLTDEQRNQIRRIRGIGIESRWKRIYPLSNAAAQVVGFIGTDEHGLAGIEQQYNKTLAGSVGQSSFFSDAARRPVRLEQCQSFAQDGADIILTLDATIQQFTHKALLKQFQEYEAESAVATVLDPCTGAVLSMVSLPDFNPADLSGADANSLGNHLLSDPYEPGSIFKPIVAAWAVETNSIDPNETIFCEDGHYRGKGFGSIGEYRQGFGNLKISEIIAHSSNIGMAKIGQKMGTQKLYEGVTLFGFGQKTGIDLPGEEYGFIRKPDKWTGYSVARVPFGHEVLVTAIQMARAFCILANDGRVVNPHLVKAIVSDTGKKLKITEPMPTGGFVVSKNTARWIIRQAMREVVTDGTGKKAALDKWEVWGKTGTANIADRTSGGYDEENYVASFIGGAPAQRPAVVVLVSIRKPNKKLSKGYTGGSVAAPVAAEILKNTLNYLEI
ncbi:MAG: penicillin-binding protein 2 [Sedimentisphaerales bacterium]|nr:penicillin-binding protein 2 [Sedimentisphaerales bacterium]